MTRQKFLEISKNLSKNLSNLPEHWDARKAILEMKETHFPQWKQMEWIGFYFQYLCEKNLSSIMEIPGLKYDKVKFDGFNIIPWDFKAHAMNTSSHKIIVNDSRAISRGIKDYGAVGLILAVGNVLYNDEQRTFQKWHDNLKGGKSKYELERIKRCAWSRLRKIKFNLRQISFIKITDKTLMKCGSFQTDFRNSNAKPRKEKISLDLEKIDEELVYYIEFPLKK